MAKADVSPSTVPIVAEFLESNDAPPIDKVIGGFRQVSLMDCTSLNLDQCLMLSVKGMKMSGG